MTEAASIQGSPTEITYAATTKAFNGDTHSGPILQYDYARTGPVKVRFLNKHLLPQKLYNYYYVRIQLVSLNLVRIFVIVCTYVYVFISEVLTYIVYIRM